MVGATVTMLFSDMEGSTLLLQRLGERYSDVIREHHRVMRLAIESVGGRVVRIAGDSFFAVFGQAAEAVSCAQRAQCELAACEWPGGEAPRVRMGIHSGAPTISDGEFVGVDVHRAARVMSVAHGGQVLLTEDAVRLLGSAVRVSDLGYHRLKDLSAPEHLFQVLAAGLTADFPPLRSLNRSNLPTPANRLVGRVEELARAVELLSRKDVRLLTLLGPGGVGKTRLSLELAADAVLRYRDGVWIVVLAPIRDEALVVSEIARVLEVAPVAGESLRQTLFARLAERELLLVLDNFEHLLDAAGVVAELLAAAPKVDVLCTSRCGSAASNVWSWDRYRRGMQATCSCSEPWPRVPSSAWMRRRIRRLPESADGLMGCRSRSRWPPRGWRYSLRARSRSVSLKGSRCLRGLAISPNDSGRSMRRSIGATSCLLATSRLCSGR